MDMHNSIFTIPYSVYKIVGKTDNEKATGSLSIAVQGGNTIYFGRIKCGCSVENALREAHKDLRAMYSKDEMILKELSYMIRQMQMNVTAETALEEFAARTGDEDVQTFVTAFNLAKRSGGDTMEIIRNVVRQMGEKIDVEREIQTVISAKKMELRIMAVIPFAMIVYLRLSFPEFLSVLYGNMAGIIIMSVCLAIYLVAYEVGKRIVDIEV